jgi:hypothetical protein
MPSPRIQTEERDTNYEPPKAPTHHSHHDDKPPDEKQPTPGRPTPADLSPIEPPPLSFEADTVLPPVTRYHRLI